MKRSRAQYSIKPILRALLMALAVMVLISGCRSTDTNTPILDNLDVINNVEGDLVLRRLSDHLWSFTAYTGEASKNGLILENQEDAGLVDPPENPDQAARLIALIREYFGKEVSAVLWTVNPQEMPEVYSLFNNLGARQHAVAALGKVQGLEGVSTYLPNQDVLILSGQTVKPLCFREPGDLDALHVSLWLEQPGLLYAGANLISQDYESLMIPVYESRTWEAIVHGLREAVPSPAIIVTASGMPGGPELYDHTADLILAWEFTLSYGAYKLPLKNAIEDAQLAEIFGKTEQVVESTLGLGADTFIGARVRTFTFNRSQISLFAPPNLQRFWLSEVDTQDPRFSTARGINVGESLELLLQKYPELVTGQNGKVNSNFSELQEQAFEKQALQESKAPLPGNFDYVYDHDTQGAYKLIFEVRSGKIDRIRMAYTLR